MRGFFGMQGPEESTVYRCSGANSQGSAFGAATPSQNSWWLRGLRLAGRRRQRACRREAPVPPFPNSAGGRPEAQQCGWQAACMRLGVARDQFQKWAELGGVGWGGWLPLPAPSNGTWMFQYLMHLW